MEKFVKFSAKDVRTGHTIRRSNGYAVIVTSADHVEGGSTIIDTADGARVTVPADAEIDVRWPR